VNWTQKIVLHLTCHGQLKALTVVVKCRLFTFLAKKCDVAVTAVFSFNFIWPITAAYRYYIPADGSAYKILFHWITYSLIASSTNLHTTFQRCISKQRSPTKQHKHYTNQNIYASHYLQFLRFPTQSSHYNSFNNNLSHIIHVQCTMFAEWKCLQFPSK